MQFPGMIPLQFAQAPSMAGQLQQLAKTAQPLAKAAGTAYNAPAVPGVPLDISPAATNAGTNMPQPGIMDALRGLSPQGILGALRGVAAPMAAPAGLPGAALFDRAGMLSAGGGG